MYVCGPTVYDYFHIGNARSFINADFIRRYLQYKGYAVTYIMNLTDIDDKIIKKANQENKNAKAVAAFYAEEFFKDIELLRVKQADLYPRATAHIAEIIAMIGKLQQQGFAYQLDDGVYFDIAAFKPYGRLSAKNLDDLVEGARVEVNEQKKSPLDFALWKASKAGEPYWESPWGKGRPGWHIECSAMSCKHLGETFDIHAGGSDLIFPHHENEIAQSEAANGKEFVRYWLHFGFLNIDNEKMSKSLGNFKTARDMLNKYPAEALRFLFAQTHYAAPLDFTDAGIDAAVNGLHRLQNFYNRINELSAAAVDEEQSPAFDIQPYYAAFEEAMDDDFNAPKAMAVIFDFISRVNALLTTLEKPARGFFRSVNEFIEKTAIGVFDIVNNDSAAPSPALENDLIQLLLNVRLELKKAKQFTLADTIREGLTNLGIELKDGKDKTTYRKK
jgi:cysteinyl-tRNA synthetase